MKKKSLFSIFFLFFLASCSEIDPWKLDAIVCNDSAFKSSRLVYTDLSSHLHLEFLKLGEEIEAFLYLDQYLFAPSSGHSKFTEILFKDAHLKWTELSPLREGKMRLKLSRKTAERLINSLQEGREIDILAGGFQETIRPGDFKTQYGRFLNGSFDFLNSLKGPLE